MRALGATISGVRHRCRLHSETRWAEFGYFRMVAARALVFRPPVKGNEDYRNEIASNLVTKENGRVLALFLRFRWGTEKQGFNRIQLKKFFAEVFEITSRFILMKKKQQKLGVTCILNMIIQVNCSESLVHSLCFTLTKSKI